MLQDERLLNEDTDGTPRECQLKLSRGGLTVASEVLENYLAIGFAIFNACDTTLHQSDKPLRIAAEHVLKKYLSVDEYSIVLRSRVLSLWLSHQEDYKMCF